MRLVLDCPSISVDYHDFDYWPKGQRRYSCKSFTLTSPHVPLSPSFLLRVPNISNSEIQMALGHLLVGSESDDNIFVFVTWHFYCFYYTLRFKNAEAYFLPLKALYTVYTATTICSREAIVIRQNEADWVGLSEMRISLK